MNTRRAVPVMVGSPRPRRAPPAAACPRRGNQAAAQRIPYNRMSSRKVAMSVRRLNHAVLYVHDLASAVDFYTGALGFEIRAAIPGRAAFLRAAGSANDHDLGLFDIGGSDRKSTRLNLQS